MNILLTEKNPPSDITVIILTQYTMNTHGILDSKQ